MTEILLLRHGEAHPGSPDFERPLTERGIGDVERVGLWLLENDLVPDLVLSSPAHRAATSAEKCLRAAGRDTSVVSFMQDIYNASLEVLLSVVGGIDEQSLVMIVGHNPGLADLAGYLAGGQRISLQPASLAHLSIPGVGPNGDPSVGQLKQALSPDDLKRK